MRLWTLHPRYLDGKGLVAAWREGLLAQKVLRGETRGYTKHPQLARFRLHEAPLEAIAMFLTEIANESARRGYRFDATKVTARTSAIKIEETDGQLRYEWRHLTAKIAARAPEWHRKLNLRAPLEPHPLFRIVAGKVRDWERVRVPRRNNR